MIQHIFFHPDFAPWVCASLSVPELHRVSRFRLADCTADRDFHPALKTSSFSCSTAIITRVGKNATPQGKIFLMGSKNRTGRQEEGGAIDAGGGIYYNSGKDKEPSGAVRRREGAD